MTLTLAYKFVAMMLMVEQASFFCQHTGLPPSRPFAEDDVRNGSHVSRYKPTDFGGSIVTDDYIFGFGWGQLANFRKRGFMPDGPDNAIRERNLELSEYSSLIDTNGAHQLATNWLAATGIDVPTLEKKYRFNLVQWKYYPEGKAGPVLLLPVYHVEWLGFILKSQPTRERAVVSVTVFGATKELVEYHVFDKSLFLRPPIAITNAESLLTISDEKFRGFDALQRSNLFARLSVPSDSKQGAGPPPSALGNTLEKARMEETVPKLPGISIKPKPSGQAVHKVAPASPQPGKK